MLFTFLHGPYFRAYYQDDESEAVGREGSRDWMGNKAAIPDIVIGRLPIYLRALNRMIQENREYTSSHELGERLGISSAQIRKDLSHFGEFGKQGTGYNVRYLYEQLRQILKVDREWLMAVVGIGDLGRAIAHYRGFPGARLSGGGPLRRRPGQGG
ncbi:MAG: hypothetical protein KatS3mg051_0073 [Anaerolineae bacterium]|nr:MAG: hypothetical protein KatS3mg051_0073 [Anaerolineae bacterium]